jgi:sigma-B regulation protein RsbU (phosphoserine phosphatase)
MSPTQRPARVLAVDDDPGVLHAVKRILGTRHELATAATPGEALKLANDFRPDLALLDIRMPELNGFELMQKLRERHPDVDVIFVTGSITDPDAHLVRAIQQGAFYFIQKPFDRQVLQALIDRCLELRALRSLADQQLSLLQLTQTRLLPQRPPDHPEYRIAFRYRPFYFATGDYYDFFPQPDGTLTVFIGDSCGHGPSACMQMATMRAILHTHPEILGNPGETLARLTRVLNELMPSDLFMTAALLHLGFDGQVAWAMAGQHPPVLMTKSEAASASATAGGLPLGISPDASYQTSTGRLSPGDRLILFTDGIVEARNRAGKLFGVPGIKQTLGTLGGVDLEAMLDGLIAAVKEHLQAADLDDDFTVLGVERIK